MDLTLAVFAIAAIAAISATLGYFLMRAKFMKQLETLETREQELARKVYETTILKEIGDRIGYSLNAAKVVEIISGSLGKLVPYSTVCYMIFDQRGEKVRFACNINEAVSPTFIADVKSKMLSATSEMTQNPFSDAELDESVSGNILSDESHEPIRSFFNLPIVISGKLVGIINVSSTQADLYNDKNTEVLYRIARLASEAASKLQDVLESEKSKLEQAVQSLSDGLLMVDKRYELLLVNKKLCGLLQTVPDPSLFDIANSLSGTLDLRTMVEEALISDEELAAKEIVVANKTLQVVASKVLDKTSEKPMGAIVIFRDVTDARALEKLRSDFTSMIIHELRAPLTNIKSTAELMKEGLEKMKKEEINKYLMQVDSTSLSMLELVNDLLDVAKMESGKFDVIAGPGDLAEVIEERVESFQPQAQERSLKLTVEIEKNLPKAYFDRVRTKQVLNNLLSNAIKFTQSGEINVRANSELVNGNPIDILVSVADTGIGMDPEEASRLFSRFGQLARGPRVVTLKGSGLGLYIAKGIIEAQGGRIWFKSEGSGMGTTFYFTVLIAANQKEELSVSKMSIPTIRKVAQA